MRYVSRLPCIVAVPSSACGYIAPVWPFTDDQQIQHRRQNRRHRGYSFAVLRPVGDRDARLKNTQLRSVRISSNGSTMSNRRHAGKSRVEPATVNVAADDHSERSNLDRCPRKSVRRLSRPGSHRPKSGRCKVTSMSCLHRQDSTWQNFSTVSRIGSLMWSRLCRAVRCERTQLASETHTADRKISGDAKILACVQLPRTATNANG